MTYSPLIAVWSSTTLPAGASGTALVVGDTPAQKLVKINTWTVPGPTQDVAAPSVYGYLALVGKLASLQTYAASAPATASGLAARQFFALLAIPSFQTFETSNPAVYSAVSAWLAAWAGDANTGITASDVSAILALAATSSAWTASVGLPTPLNANDVAAAGLS